MARAGRDHERPIPAHPYRDTAIVYGAMAAILVLVAWLTGGDVARAGLVAVAFFVVATAWTWWRFRERIRQADAAKVARAAQAPAESGGRDTASGRANGNGRGGAK